MGQTNGQRSIGVHTDPAPKEAKFGETTETFEQLKRIAMKEVLEGSKTAKEALKVFPRSLRRLAERNLKKLDECEPKKD
jgi:hypothetical protein